MARNEGPRGPYHGTHDEALAAKRDGCTGCPNLALELRKARKAIGLTQAQLAERIGATRSHLAQWETGRRAVMPRDFDAITKVIKAELDSWADVERRALRQWWSGGVHLRAEDG